MEEVPPDRKLRKIQELAKTSMSMTAIAETVGVSRLYVLQVIEGKLEPRGKIHTVSSVASRCRKCGYKVQMPCRICRARELAGERN